MSTLYLQGSEGSDERFRKDTEKSVLGDNQACFIKEAESKMHTEEQIDLILGGNVGDGFLEEARIDDSPGQGGKQTSFQSLSPHPPIIK